VPEVLDGGRLGKLIASADPDALARALIELLGDSQRRSELAASGRAELESRYPIALMIQRHEALYQRLAGTINV